MSGVTPFIWFEDTAEEAMEYYVSVFPDTKIIDIERYAGGWGIPGEDKLVGKVLNGTFELMGQRFQCLDGGPLWKITGAISFLVEFDTQAELDSVWDKLVADGGQPQQCGWITDKFGVVWQITPTTLGAMMSDESATAEQKKALMQCMMPMVKLESGELEAAFEAAK